MDFFTDSYEKEKNQFFSDIVLCDLFFATTISNSQEIKDTLKAKDLVYQSVIEYSKIPCL